MSRIQNILGILALLAFIFVSNPTSAQDTSKVEKITPISKMDSLKLYYRTRDSAEVKNKKEENEKKQRDAVRIGYEIIGGDTIPVYLFNDLYIESLKSEEEIRRYKILVRNVKVALPYAKLAAFRLQMMEDNLSMIKSKKARKKYISECEKAIKEEFMNDLKNLTVSQGKLLLKLIHRETGKTTWEILNTYQGWLEPIFWNSMAKMYGATTKETFDPALDREIDEIIKKLELE